MVLGELLVALAWTYGANGFLLERQLGGSVSLPSAWVEPVAASARVVFHDRREWAMAFYLPAGVAAAGVPAAGVPAAGEVPRLYLYAPYYLAPDGLPPAPRMPVDVAEYYFHALLEAALDLRIAAEPAWAAAADRRAAELMSEVPEIERRSVYLAALGDFGAHVLSIANEIDRAARRQRAAGRDVCPQIELPGPLFGLWARSFGDAPYRGRYRAPGGAGAPRWTRSRRGLERRDKEVLVRQVLRVAWSGDPARDFAALCPGAAATPVSAVDGETPDGR